ncbi:hypothetical protein H6P81_014936 [Aristolochia fimbriata]|uniref:Thymidine kinase n=1 Tax=Aristolochia fimbriata TaxID=158543 RepID=A0AAV7E6Z9_ARIFI|nr:hypothetical protein H6P81_014936 [Aristolochia fimbriata]
MPSISTMKSLLSTLRTRSSPLTETLIPSTSRTKLFTRFFSVPSISSLRTPTRLRSTVVSATSPVSFSTNVLFNGKDLPMEPTAPSGEIHVIVGPMFAGKTTALLRRLQSECDNGRKVAVIKSNKDTRYGLDSVVTHDGVKMPCWALPDLTTLKIKLGAEEYEQLDVIGIDEAQFFGDLYDFCCKAADHDGKVVIVAGLDGDYLRRNFGSVLDVIPLADSVTKLTARCELCGKRAFFTLRKTEETQTELIGGADVYMPVCRRHYVSGQVVIEATRNVLETQKLMDSSDLEAAAVPV